MRKIKYFLIILLISTFGVFSIPYLDGFFFRKNFISTIHSINQNSEIHLYPIKIEIIDYKLGWLHSDAKLRTVFLDKEMANFFPKGLNTNYHIDHGPFVYDPIHNHYATALGVVKNEIYLPAFLQTLLLGKEKSQPLAKIDTIVSFTNKWIHQIHIATLAIPMVGSMNISDTGLTTNFSIENNILKAFDSSAVTGTINLQSKSNPFIPNVTVQPIHFSQSLKHQSSDLMDSEIQISVPSILMKWKNDKTFEIKTIHYVDKENFDSNYLYKGNYNFTISKFSIPSEVIASISSLNVNLGLENLQLKATSEFADFLGAHTDKPFNETDTKKFLNLLEAMTTPKSQLDLNLAFNSSLGDFLFKLKVNKIANAPMMKSIGGVLDSFVFEADTTIPAALLNKLMGIYLMKINEEAKLEAKTSKAKPIIDKVSAQELIDSWIKQGYFTRNNNDYVIRISTKGGVLKVNGKTLDQKVN